MSILVLETQTRAAIYIRATGDGCFPDICIRRDKYRALYENNLRATVWRESFAASAKILVKKVVRKNKQTNIAGDNS